ncbi:hypothetical protein [Bradyrhizobium retamae]|uniref:Uncharacterized protein n=1 Tax=Bradyrhizobium retamae TaxID=1300035 RepID=A0A0R3NHJ3_9BRAD|nr:hypothetical protein [Bradyrhizobium retamae]KRR29206.1 hypothetical protein CQ13_16910 [Bradyrhizobium retamae]
MNYGFGVALLAVAAMLLYAGRPDKDGASPRFLRFNAALVLYPPFVLVFLAFGSALLINAL